MPSKEAEFFNNLSSYYADFTVMPLIFLVASDTEAFISANLE